MPRSLLRFVALIPLTLAVPFFGCGGDDSPEMTLSISATATAATTATATATTTATGTTTTGETDSGSAGESSGGCVPGTEGCACDDGACGDDLVCEADVCVSPPAASCGDGTVDEGEECDDGNDVDTDACLSTCVNAVCGDGETQARVEGCDDGNTDDGDGCSSTCVLESCGDGVIQGAEECDDGNDDETDACLSTCLSASCGDGYIYADVEECDDGNDDDTDACPASCLAATCGDGFTQADVEECDDGNDDDTDECLTTCVSASCGDGQVQAGVEECDDGNDDDTDNCPSTCMTATCGDGFVYDPIEECDDGNNDPNDGCAADCLFECGDDCWGDKGCQTAEGRCIRFTCTPGSASQTACDTCMGWQQITYQNWLNDGYCSDVSAKYRQVLDHATMCGGAPICCATPGACAGGDNAWHFHDGANNRFVGPCLGCQGADNCTYWNGTDNGNYTRITACERP